MGYWRWHLLIVSLIQLATAAYRIGVDWGHRYLVLIVLCSAIGYAGPGIAGLIVLMARRHWRWAGIPSMMVQGSWAALSALWLLVDLIDFVTSDFSIRMGAGELSRHLASSGADIVLCVLSILGILQIGLQETREAGGPTPRLARRTISYAGAARMKAQARKSNPDSKEFSHVQRGNAGCGRRIGARR
jgi:hypothetical protein